uniref:Uncharacterized protein n=1 Tax=Oryza glumipatula TaxID=40148 RepID=A0A0D9Y5G1_9ORYZ
MSPHLSMQSYQGCRVCAKCISCNVDQEHFISLIAQNLLYQIYPLIELFYKGNINRYTAARKKAKNKLRRKQTLHGRKWKWYLLARNWGSSKRVVTAMRPFPEGSSMVNTCPTNAGPPPFPKPPPPPALPPDAAAAIRAPRFDSGEAAAAEAEEEEVMGRMRGTARWGAGGEGEGEAEVGDGDGEGRKGRVEAKAWKGLDADEEVVVVVERPRGMAVDGAGRERRRYQPRKLMSPIKPMPPKNATHRRRRGKAAKEKGEKRRRGEARPRGRGGLGDGRGGANGRWAPESRVATVGGYTILDWVYPIRLAGGVEEIVAWGSSRGSWPTCQNRWNITILGGGEFDPLSPMEASSSAIEPPHLPTLTALP